jgi:hypothetical protein
LGVGGLWQSRKHLQRNQHHGAALQSPVRGVDSTFQSDTSRKLRERFGAAGEYNLSAITVEARVVLTCHAQMK